MAEPDDDCRIIESIFNYCDRRCERCMFTEGCTLFKDLRKYERQHHPDRGPFEQVRDHFQDVFRLLEQWCEREGIDFDELQREAFSDQSDGTVERRHASVRADPLQRIATAYTHAALKLVDALAAARTLRAWPPGVAEAIDTIAWHAGLVSSKTYRALVGFAERDDPPEEDDPVQSDWNGSAKVARLLIAESKDAWFVVMRAGEAADDSPLTELVSLLERLDAGLTERFPRAMEFTRPGFDEPWLADYFPIR
jgi:hypothetical protein